MFFYGTDVIYKLKDKLLFLNKQTHRFHPKNYFQDLSPILFIKKMEIYRCNNTDRIWMSNKGLCTKFSRLNRISYDLTRVPNSYSSKISGNCTRTDRNAIWRYFASIRTTWLCCVLRQFSSNRSQHIYEVTRNRILNLRLGFRDNIKIIGIYCDSKKTLN